MLKSTFAFIKFLGYTYVGILLGEFKRTLILCLMSNEL